MSVENNGKDKDVQFLEGYLKENPESILFARLADSYLKMEKIDEAIELCEDGIKKHPYYATGHFVLGKGYMAKNLFEQAEKEFKRVLLFDPKFLAAHKLYGDLMKEIGWENTCEMSYKKILQIDPLDEVARSMVDESVPVDDKAENDEQSTQPATSETATEAIPEPEKQSETKAKPEIDLDVISPMPISPEEEDLLFEEPEPASSADQTEQPIITRIEEETAEIDEKKAEEFSYILDDIFKDEVVAEDSSSKSVNTEKRSTDEMTPSFQKEPENFLSDFQTSKDETKHDEYRSEPELAPSKTEAEFRSDELDTGNVESKANLNEEVREVKTPSVAEAAQDKTSRTAKRKKQGDKIVTPTLGEIYAAQGQYSKAIDVFETLIKKHPDNEFYINKIAALKQKLEASKNESKS